MRPVIIFCLLLFSCTANTIPSGILPPEKMKVIIFDLVRIDEYAGNYLTRDSTIKIQDKRLELYTKVFALHHTTKDEFYKSYRFYEQHPDKQKLVFDSLATWGSKVMEKPAVKGTNDSLIHK
jgi:hypothetical protein